MNSAIMLSDFAVFSAETLFCIFLLTFVKRKSKRHPSNDGRVPRFDLTGSGYFTGKALEMRHDEQNTQR